MAKRKRGLSGTNGGKPKNKFLARLADQSDKRTSTKFIRSGVDVGGAIAGGLLGAAIGKNAAIFGVGVLVAGSFMNDHTGLSTTIGAGMLAYGVAKILQNNDIVDGLAGPETTKERISKYKDELMAAFYLDKIFKKGETPTADGDGESVGALDLSSLDFFDDNNHQEATEFEINRDYETQALPDYTVSALPSQDFSFAVIDDMPDYSTM